MVEVNSGNKELKCCCGEEIAYLISRKSFHLQVIEEPCRLQDGLFSHPVDKEDKFILGATVEC
jgi:hypothetical protein